MYEAKIIADSICNGNRLTTMQLTHPKCIHQDFMTHCMFARNASSSRAIPFEKTLKQLRDDPFIPQTFGKNQKGMQSSVDLSRGDYELAVHHWLEARDAAMAIASRMANPQGLNIHKQDVNRLLEPWMWITLCVTGDPGGWSNYFALRCHPDADPKLQPQAYMAQLEYFTSKPVEKTVGQWHLPYLNEEDIFALPTSMAPKVSVGRCARTSYLTQEGKRDYTEDLQLHDRLRDHRPMHASPFEHVCQAEPVLTPKTGKFNGWKSYRHMLSGEYVTDFKPNHPMLIAPLGSLGFRLFEDEK